MRGRRGGRSKFRLGERIIGPDWRSENNRLTMEDNLGVPKSGWLWFEWLLLLRLLLLLGCLHDEQELLLCFGLLTHVVGLEAVFREYTIHNGTKNPSNPDLEHSCILRLLGVRIVCSKLRRYVRHLGLKHSLRVLRLYNCLRILRLNRRYLRRQLGSCITRTKIDERRFPVRKARVRSQSG